MPCMARIPCRAHRACCRWIGVHFAKMKSIWLEASDNRFRVFAYLTTLLQPRNTIFAYLTAFLECEKRESQDGPQNPYEPIVVAMLLCLLHTL